MCVCWKMLLMSVLESAIVFGAGKCHLLMLAMKHAIRCWKVPCVDVGAGKCHNMLLVLDSANCGCWKVP